MKSKSRFFSKWNVFFQYVCWKWSQLPGLLKRIIAELFWLLAWDLKNQKEEFFFISGGILEVQPHVVTVLSDAAIRADDLNEAAAIEAKQRAEAALADQQSEFDIAKARAEIAIAAAQIAAIQKLRKR